MKKIITILFLIIAYTSFAQQSTPDSAKFAWYRYQYGLRQPRIIVDTLFDFPKDTIYSKYGLVRKGSSLFVGNGIKWTSVAGCDTCVVRDFAFDSLTVKSILVNGDTIPAFVMILDSSWYNYFQQYGVKYGDTAAMLDPYKFHEIITYQKTLINQGVTPLSQYNQIDAGGFEQDYRNSPLWYLEGMNTTDSSKAILVLNASNADSPFVVLQSQNVGSVRTSKIEINKHWPQISKNGGAGKNIVTSINGTSLADTSGNVNISTGSTYTATHGVVIQGTNIKLQDTLNGAGTKFMWLFNKHAFRAGSVTGGSATNWDYDSIGTGSVAMGDNSKATGLGGIAIGRGATAAGQSIALGTFSHALGGNSVAIATLSSNSANGTNSISIGDNIATGTGSISMNGDAFADKSVAIGAGTTAKHYAGSVFGYFNDTATAASATTFNLLNRAFQVGIGNGSSGADQYRNGLTILFNGKTTLNKYGAGTFTGTPTYVLAVNSVGDIIETALSGGGTVTNVTGTAPVIITGTSTVTPNVTVDTSKAIGRLATFSDVGAKLDTSGSYVNAGEIIWPGTIYTTPTTGVKTNHVIRYSPALASQSAYTVLGRASGSGTPSFVTLDSNYISGHHTEPYFNTKYAALGSTSQWVTTGSDIYYNTGKVGIGATSAPTSKLHIITAALGVTQANSSGIMLENTTDAAAGAQQISPALTWRGRGWKTTATAASQTTDWQIDVLPIEGTTNPTSAWRLRSSINGGAYTFPFIVTSAGNVGIGVTQPASVLTIKSTGGIGFDNGAGNVTDAILVRDSAFIVALQSGASPLSLRVYTTFTDASNYARVQVDGSSAFNGLGAGIFNKAAGSGSVANFHFGTLGSSSSYIVTNATRRWQVDPSGHLLAVTDNANDIGASAATRPRTIYVGTSVGVAVAPTSALHTTSFAKAYRAITALRTLDNTDNTIDCTANTFTVTLPTAVGITGREYWITNTGSGTITIATTSSQTFTNVTGTPTTLTVAQFTNYKVVSTGANWLAYKIVN